MTDQQWLPTPKAAAFLGVSPDTLKRRRDTVGGFLVYGRHWQFRTDSPNTAILWRVELIREEMTKRGAVNAREAQLERAAEKVIAGIQKAEVMS